MGQLGLSLATGMSFFNVQSVLLTVLYLFVTAQLFGGTFADKLTACLINGTMCLLVENTVNYTYSWFTGVRTGEALRSTRLPRSRCAPRTLSWVQQLRIPCAAGTRSVLCSRCRRW